MKRTKLLMVFLTLLLPLSSWADDPTEITTRCVLLLKGNFSPGDKSTSNSGGLSDDEYYAAQWFYENYAHADETAGSGKKGTIINVNDLESKYTLNPGKTKVVWVHLDGAYTADIAVARGYATTAFSGKSSYLGNYVKNGGNLYLSKYATTLVSTLGRVGSDYQPNLANEVNVDNKKGINPQIGYGNQLYDHQYHPIFAGMTPTIRDGHITYNFLSSNSSAGTGLKWNFNAVTGLTDNPNKLVDFEIKTNSIVLGAWEHVTDYACAGLIEFLPLVSRNGDDSKTGTYADYKGRIICNGQGGYDWDENRRTGNVGKLTENTLEYLSKAKLKKVAYLLPRNLNSSEASATESFDKYKVAVDADDEATALKWFYDEIATKGKGDILQPKDLADLDPTAYTTMWIHIDRDDIGRPNGNSDAFNELDHTNIYHMLQCYVKNGGNLLLTKHAVDMIKGGCLGRAKDAPTTFDVGLAKDNPDVWAINAVIGAGYVSDQSITESYKYWSYDAVNTEGTNGKWAEGTEDSWPTNNYNKYVSYFWRHDDCYATQQRGSGDIFDHRNNGLYNYMEVSSGKYPLNPSEGFGVIKYDVINIVGPGFKEDHNCIWVFQNTTDNVDGQLNWTLPFQKNNKCDVLGQWAHKSQLDNAAIVDFKPCYTTQIGENMSDNDNTWTWNEDAWEGRILCIGLGAYEWQPSNTDGTARTGENPYLNNIKQLTYNALNILDNPTEEDVYYLATYEGVTYELHTHGISQYAKIKSAVSGVQVYDLTKNNDKMHNGQINDEGGTHEAFIDGVSQGEREFAAATYNITYIMDGAFTSCLGLAYADLMKFQGVIPSNIRDKFALSTLIYVPREEAISLDKCAVKGENIINTYRPGHYVGETLVRDDNDVKECEHLKIYDNESGAEMGYTDWVYHLFANKYEFNAKEVSFNRTFSNGVKTTVALPFAISAEEANSLGQFYTFAGIIGDSKARFVEVAGTEAYKPYMFIPSSTGSINIPNVTKNITKLDGDITDGYELTNPVDVCTFGNASNPDFIAPYRPKAFALAKSLGVYMYKNGTYQTTSTGTIYADPFRGYVKLPAGVGAARVLDIIFEDSEVTGISEVRNHNEDADCYYTLSGVRVIAPTRGIYVKNGKKVIIK